MGTTPTPTVQVAATVVPAATVNSQGDLGNYLAGRTATNGSKRPSAELRQTTSQSPATGVWTDITMDAAGEDLDTDGGHTGSSAQYVAQTAGWYLISGGVSWSGNATASRRGARIAKTPSGGASAAVPGSQVLIPSANANGLEVPCRTMKVQLAVGDSVSIQGFQDAAATLATVVASPGQSSMSLTWMHV